ncbi:hypothetical protein EDB19DRAFT_1835713 [Suillus lakei]|nr:hypothetical protein EDB19DRAFT_1835713 [Suillus lakei]
MLQTTCQTLLDPHLGCWQLFRFIQPRDYYFAGVFAPQVEEGSLVSTMQRNLAHGRPGDPNEDCKTPTERPKILQTTWNYTPSNSNSTYLNERMLELSRVTHRAIAARMQYQRIHSHELDLIKSILEEETTTSQKHMNSIDLQIGSLGNILHDGGVVIGTKGFAQTAGQASDVMATKLYVCIAELGTGTGISKFLLTTQVYVSSCGCPPMVIIFWWPIVDFFKGSLVTMTGSSHGGQGIYWYDMWGEASDLITENNRRYDGNLNGKDTATINEDRLHAGYNIFMRTLPWLLKNSSDMEHDTYTRLLKMLRQGADGARGDNTSKLKTLVVDARQRISPDFKLVTYPKISSGRMSDLSPEERPAIKWAGKRMLMDLLTSVVWPHNETEESTTTSNGSEPHPQSLSASAMLQVPAQEVYTVQYMTAVAELGIFNLKTQSTQDLPLIFSSVTNLSQPKLNEICNGSEPHLQSLSASAMLQVTSQLLSPWFVDPNTDSGPNCCGSKYYGPVNQDVANNMSWPGGYSTWKDMLLGILHLGQLPQPMEWRLQYSVLVWHNMDSPHKEYMMGPTAVPPPLAPYFPQPYMVPGPLYGHSIPPTSATYFPQPQIVPGPLYSCYIPPYYSYGRRDLVQMPPLTVSRDMCNEKKQHTKAYQFKYFQGPSWSVSMHILWQGFKLPGLFEVACTLAGLILRSHAPTLVYLLRRPSSVPLLDLWFGAAGITILTLPFFAGSCPGSPVGNISCSAHYQEAVKQAQENLIYTSPKIDIVGIRATVFNSPLRDL